MTPAGAVSIECLLGGGCDGPQTALQRKKLALEATATRLATRVRRGRQRGGLATWPAIRPPAAQRG